MYITYLTPLQYHPCRHSVKHLNPLHVSGGHAWACYGFWPDHAMWRASAGWGACFCAGITVGAQARFWATGRCAQGGSRQNLSVHAMMHTRVFKQPCYLFPAGSCSCYGTVSRSRLLCDWPLMHRSLSLPSHMQRRTFPWRCRACVLHRYSERQEFPREIISWSHHAIRWSFIGSQRGLFALSSRHSHNMTISDASSYWHWLLLPHLHCCCVTPSYGYYGV